MKEFRKVLIYIDSILLPKGFSLFESEESGCIICDYRKSTNQSINSIAFLKREDKIKGFYYAVNFIEMELIIIPILTKNKLFGDVKPEKIDESFWVQKDTRYTLSDDGKDISEYEEVVNIFNLFYKQEALPFFQKGIICSYLKLYVFFIRIIPKDIYQLAFLVGCPIIASSFPLRVTTHTHN